MIDKSNLPRVICMRKRHGNDLMKDFLQQCLANDATRTSVPSMRSKRALRDQRFAFSYALAFDPTPKAVYLSTIVRWLSSGAIRFEDGRDVRTILSKFHAEKARLPKEQRDIGGYLSPGDLAATIDPLADIVVSRVPQHLENESSLVSQGSGWGLFRITGTKAATWWADSTHWCTRHPETAEQYLDKGPLYVLASRNNKYQVHVQEQQAMDRYDRSVAAMDDMPIEAIEALVHAVDEENSAHRFSRGSLPLLLAMILDVRDGGSRVRSRSLLDPGEVLLMQEPWISRDNTCSAFGRNGTGVLEMVVSDGGALVHRAIERDDFHSEIEEPNSPLFDLIRSGGDRTIGNSKGDGVHRFFEIGKNNEISFVCRQLAIPIHNASVLVHEGSRFLSWTTKLVQRPDKAPAADTATDHLPWAVDVLDLDAPPGERHVRMVSPKDFAAAPERIKTAVRLQQSKNPAGPWLLVLGSDSVDPLANPWSEGRRMHDLLETIINRTWIGPDYDDLLTVAFQGPQLAAARRLFSALSFEDLRIDRIETSDPPTAEDLLLLSDIPRSGTLLAALPDEACTEALVDTMIEKQRYDVIKVMPARLLTLERLMPLFTNNSRLVLEGRYASRVVSRSSYLAISTLGLMNMDETIDSRSQLFTIVHDFIVRKGSAALMRAGMYSVRDSRGRSQFPTIDEAEDLPKDEEKLLAVRRMFDGIPLVGRPWPLMLEAFDHAGKEEQDAVREEIERGGWGDRDRRMQQLHEATSAVGMVEQNLDPEPCRMRA